MCQTTGERKPLLVSHPVEQGTTCLSFRTYARLPASTSSGVPRGRELLAAAPDDATKAARALCEHASLFRVDPLGLFAGTRYRLAGVVVASR